MHAHPESRTEFRAPAGPVPARSTTAAGPVPRATAVRREAPARAHGSLPERVSLAVVLAIPAAATLWGLPYYLLSRADRVRSPLHPLLRPSGTIGLAFGIAGLAMFLFMWLYAIRKSVRWLAWTGNVGAWLRVHVVVGLTVPVVVAVHAGWRFEGLIGLGYLSMVVVCLSGVVGRYLYVHIPRSRNGLELTLDEVAGERRSIITRIAAATGIEPQLVERSLTVDARSYEGLDPLRTMLRMMRDDFARVRSIERLRRAWSAPRPGARPPNRAALAEAMRLARREMALAQQVRMLEATRRVFGYWHVAHRPFAITALLAVLVHVIVAVLVGAVSLG